MYRKLSSVFSCGMLLMVMLLGCAIKDGNELTKETKQVKNYINISRIPSVQGLQVKEIAVKLDEGIEHESTAHQGTVIITYTNNRGQEIKDVKTDQAVNYIYGPYDGEQIMKIEMSNKNAELQEGLQQKTINGFQLYYKNINNRLIAFTEHKNISFTLEGRVTEEFSEEKQFELFTEAISKL
ncbi:hypothetical protein J2Z32_001803 [Paenibacillus turicensis]|uniref:Lipoprotein n=2 Tax=Paenibacillus turicensis TaxID=160487 RepID=A0ABS4FRI0_9BACL|nr:hypothetical protein [Paenibacillus turicensis]